MLSVFPIMFLSLLAHTLLRFFTGLVIFYYAISRLKNFNAQTQSYSLALFFSLCEIVVGAMIFFGALAQVASLGLFFYTCLALLTYKKIAHYMPPRTVLVLYMGIALSLTITGAGAFAFDLPF